MNAWLRLSDATVCRNSRIAAMKISLMFFLGNNSSCRIPLMRLIKKTTHIPITVNVSAIYNKNTVETNMT